MTVPQGAFEGKDADGKDTIYYVDIDPDADFSSTITCTDEQGNTKDILISKLWETGMDEVYGFRYPDGIKTLKKQFATWTDEDKSKWDLQSLIEEGILT
jgi:hypothetical protein